MKFFGLGMIDMCGFAGILGPADQLSRSVLNAMAKSLAHRGPDDEGIETIRCAQGDFSLALVHRRLSIIDLSSAAHQPMIDESTGNWIVYNGEIYNFFDLRVELREKGHTFKSHSDTETLLKAYSEYGVECLQKLRGMYAFAIWDQRLERLFLAVDRFGIKPLYFYQGPKGEFVFASELRTLLKSDLIVKKIEPLAVDSFLAYGAVQAPLTMIRGVYALLPAQYILYHAADHDIQFEKYWNPSPAAEPLNDPQETTARMRELLNESTEKHLVSDVPVGLFLSGGIDSSSTAILANRLKKGQLQSFSISFSESSYSEEKYFNLIADRFCKHHTEIKLSIEELLGILPDAIKAMDQPTIDGINIYTISKAVRNAGIKVVLSGQGGDEIFGGYSTFRRVPMMLRVRCYFGIFPRPVLEKTAHLLSLLTKRSEVGLKYSQIIGSGADVLSQYLILRQLFSPGTREYLTGIAYNQEVINGLPSQVVESLNHEIEGLDVFNQVSLLDTRLYLANMLLRDGDVMSMAHGLEIRVPFLDHKVVEYVFKVHRDLKIKRHLKKPLLVNAMDKLLPEEIYMRPKMGFVFPWEIWLRNRLRTQVDELIKDFPKTNELGLNINSTKTIWGRFLSNAPGISWSRVWALYVLMKWYRENLAA